MKLIAHRGLWTEPSSQNSLSAIRAAFEAGHDVETDLRSFQGVLYLSHDPILDPSSLARFESLLVLIKAYPSRRVFVNIKEDGLVPLLRPFQPQVSSRALIFFDMSVPELVRYAKQFSAHQLCTRISEFEIRPAGIELCDWVWVDGFYKDPDLSSASVFVTQQKKSIVLVSPELHGRSPDTLWTKIQSAGWLDQDRISLCTDSPGYAAKLFSPVPAMADLRAFHDQSHSF